MRKLLVLFQIGLIVSAFAQSNHKYTGPWPRSSPEAQGLSSVELNQLFDYVNVHNTSVHSIQVLRHGHLVLDAYFYPYTGETKHDIASVTKSINSTLIGIAIDKHYVSGIQNKALQYFPEYHIQDSLKQQITLEDLITMRSGLDCGADLGDPAINVDKRLAEIRQCKDWIKCILSIPMHGIPGQKFAYCNGNCQLLSAVISKATHKSLAEFAKQELFAPIGITDFYWPEDPNGINYGWADLQLHPYDMLKFGELMLRNGKWQNKEIVSENWLKEATKIHVTNTGGNDKYGYYWWLPGSDYPDVFEAVGRGGQRITVWPSKDMVIVFTGGGFNTSDLVPFIANAIKADGSIPANPGANEQLKNNIAHAVQPPSQKPIAKWPSSAATISGTTYQLQSNSLDLTRLQFVFGNKQKAVLYLTWAGKKVVCDIGLDGRDKFTYNPIVRLPQACAGEWINDTTFSVKLNLVGGINLYTFHCTFLENGKTISVALSEGSGLNNEIIAGQKVK